MSLLAGERLGAGVVVDGRLLRGAHGGAGEMVFLDDIPAVGGAWGLGFRTAEWAREAVEPGTVAADSGLLDASRSTRSTRPPSSRSPARAMRDARRVVERVGVALATIAGVFGSLFDSSLVVVSGAVSEGIEIVLDAARAATPAHLDLPAPRIVASPLGADVVSIGAVARARAAVRADVLSLTRSRTPAR